jgi:hypothetical protein
MPADADGSLAQQATAALAGTLAAGVTEGGLFGMVNVTAEMEILAWGLGSVLPVAGQSPVCVPLGDVTPGVTAVMGALRAATAALPGALRAAVLRYVDAAGAAGPPRAAEPSGPASDHGADAAARDTLAEAATSIICFATSVPEVGTV